jgi:hypothetical protein
LLANASLLSHDAVSVFLLKIWTALVTNEGFSRRARIARFLGRFQSGRVVESRIHRAASFQ